MGKKSLRHVEIDLRRTTVLCVTMILCVTIVLCVTMTPVLLWYCITMVRCFYYDTLCYPPYGSIWYSVLLWFYLVLCGTMVICVIMIICVTRMILSCFFVVGFFSYQIVTHLFSRKLMYRGSGRAIQLHIYLLNVVNRISFSPTYQICKIEEKLIRLTTFNKYICNWTLEVRDVLKRLWKRGEIAP